MSMFVTVWEKSGLTQPETATALSRAVRGRRAFVWNGNCTWEYRKKHKIMLWTVFVVLLVLWALGIGTSYTMGGFIHVLLVLAVVTVLIRVIQGRRAI